MKRCSRCLKTKSFEDFGRKKDGKVYARCQSCRDEQVMWQKRGLKMNEMEMACHHHGVPLEAIPHLKRAVRVLPARSRQQAYALQQAWEIAVMQKNVPLCNFDPDWKPVIELARKLA